MAAVIVTADLREFFRGPLADVRRRQRLDVRHDTEQYLVTLLAEGPTVAGPMALTLAKANEVQGPERLELLRKLGDVALYMAGWWLDAVLKGPMDPSYYASMGASAYSTLASATRGPVFAELASKFARLIDVLQELYEKLALATPEGTLKLYERFLRTESDRLRWQLQAEGLLSAGSKRLN